MYAFSGLPRPAQGTSSVIRVNGGGYAPREATIARPTPLPAGVSVWRAPATPRAAPPTSGFRVADYVRGAISNYLPNGGDGDGGGGEPHYPPDGVGGGNSGARRLGAAAPANGQLDCKVIHTKSGFVMTCDMPDCPGGLCPGAPAIPPEGNTLCYEDTQNNMDSISYALNCSPVLTNGRR